jgi:diacylglycerol kinase family enzyme
MSTYYFIYDNYLSDRRYERALAAVETRLTDLGLSGRIGRLNAFTNARGLVRDETRRGVKTIVVVGNDETVAKVVSGIGEADVTLGIIPVGQPNDIARALGIPEGVESCDILSRRVTQKVDLGRINGQLFLSEVRVPSADYAVEIEGKYRIFPQTEGCEVIVSNMRGFGLLPTGSSRDLGNPQDGVLDAMIMPRPGRWFGGGKEGPRESTVIPVKQMIVRGNEPFEAYVDTAKTSGAEMVIEVAPGRLKVITGRERVFGAT